MVKPKNNLSLSRETPILPAVIDANQLAATIVEALDLIATRLNLDTPQPSTARRVRAGRMVSREFVSSLAAAVEASPRLQRLRTFDTENAREVLESADSFRLVAERLSMLLTRVNYTMEAKWAELARTAMATYAIATTIADEDDPELLAHLEILRRHLGRKGRTLKKKSARKKGSAED